MGSITSKNILKVFPAFLLLLAPPGLAFAAPAITDVSGSFSHGQSVTISGGGFGEKASVAPAVWDDGSGTSILDKWSGGWPSTASASEWNIQYKQAGFRGILGPHDHAGRYIAGLHKEGGSPFSPHAGTNVGVWKEFDMNSYPQPVYLSWYERLDPLWDNTFNIDYNAKYFSYSGDSSSPYDNPYWYLAWNQSPRPKDGSYPTGIREHVFGGAGITSQFPDINSHGPYWLAGNNPVDQWLKIEMEMMISNDRNQGYVKLWEDGVPKIDFHGSTDNAYSGYAFAMPGKRLLQIGGFTRFPADSNFLTDHNWRYFSDLYIDTSFQRVQICEGSTWSNKGLCEVQIPQTAWNDSSVSMKVNQASFADNSTAYLYVVDQNGAANSDGYPVAFASAGNGIPPASPVGLAVE